MISLLTTLLSLIAYDSNKSYTFPFENRKNIAAIALSPDANVLVTVDEGAFNCQ
jgi:periodic tryptophan protein 2